MKHSPTPWHTGTDEDAHIIYDSNLHYVAEVADEEGDAEQQKAVAKLIVEAVNVYAVNEQLLEQANRFRDELVELLGACPIHGNCFPWLIEQVKKLKGG